MSEQIQTTWIYLNIVFRRGLWISCINIFIIQVCIISFYETATVHYDYLQTMRVVHFLLWCIIESNFYSAVFRHHYKMSDTRNTAVNKRTEQFRCTESLVVFDLLVNDIKAPEAYGAKSLLWYFHVIHRSVCFKSNTPQ